MRFAAARVESAAVRAPVTAPRPRNRPGSGRKRAAASRGPALRRRPASSRRRRPRLRRGTAGSSSSPSLAGPALSPGRGRRPIRCRYILDSPAARGASVAIVTAPSKRAARRGAENRAERRRRSAAPAAPASPPRPALAPPAPAPPPVATPGGFIRVDDVERLSARPRALPGALVDGRPPGVGRRRPWRLRILVPGSLVRRRLASRLATARRGIALGHGSTPPARPWAAMAYADTRRRRPRITGAG